MTRPWREAGTKPCQFCGVPVPSYAAIVGCAPCQRYNRKLHDDEHPWLVEAARKRRV